MMTTSDSSLTVSGVTLMSDHEMDFHSANHDLSSVVSSLKEELQNCKIENKKLTDQLNCLLSLIRRSWTGDRLATIHLSKIIGVNPINSEHQNGSSARANSADVTYSKKKRCEQNWERLAYKLLEREYTTSQKELRLHQQHYLENRQLYMDAVLNDHHNNLSALPSHHRYDKFAKTSSGRGRGLRRTQSADSRRLKTAGNIVEQNDISLHDLVGVTDFNVPTHPLSGQATSEPHTITPTKYLPRRVKSSTQVKRLPPNTYNDAARYAQKNLFELNENDVVRKPRPVSASSLYQGDIQRSKPRMNRRDSSECQLEEKVFITQTNERALKYETTRPVTAKPKSGKQHRMQTSEVGNESTTSLMNASAMKVNSAIVDHTPIVGEGTDVAHNVKSDTHQFQFSSDRVDTKPPTGSRINSGFTRRPKFIDEFTDDEQKMKDIEDEFKKKALLLQKKLGLCESGFVKLD